MNVVIYHRNCNDGLFAALAMWATHGHDAIYIPVDYKPIHDQTPEQTLEYLFGGQGAGNIDMDAGSLYSLDQITPDKYELVNIHVVDFSLPVEHYFAYLELFKSVTIIDHHASAVDKYTEAFTNHPTTDLGKIERGGETYDVFVTGLNGTVILSNKHSGALMTYNVVTANDSFLSPDEYHKLGVCVNLASDRDMWKFELEDSKKFHSGIKFMAPKSFQNLLIAITEDYDQVIKIGQTVLDNLNQNIKRLRSSVTLGGSAVYDSKKYTVGFINTELDIASDMCNDIIVNEGVDIAIAYHIRRKGEVSCSIRSAVGVDCSVIAKHFGGGGHKNASGFHTDLEKLTSWLTGYTIVIPD